MLGEKGRMSVSGGPRVEEPSAERYLIHTSLNLGVRSWPQAQFRPGTYIHDVSTGVTGNNHPSKGSGGSKDVVPQRALG